MAGGVVHFEIPADDEHRAREFYRSIFGWEFQVLPEMEYSLAVTTPMDEHGRPSVSGSINGGLYRRTAQLSAPLVTVDVADIDAALAQIVAQGGSVHREKLEVPGSGWNAYFKDSEGNVLGLWQNAPARGSAGSPAAEDDLGA
ncbi:VOC family protein [Arthrobacter sp. H16F315]|uniref:VOC family protein n=1 Tax=Arthrobacter sp. H16F315 TaxID=2955314 RepID=UPI0020985732|nr:VOC family protein [Arthrobacter sp. H16F315]MDD1476729.1 VOC family protein [Arthrobacter sp. H16F315]